MITWKDALPELSRLEDETTPARRVTAFACGTEAEGLPVHETRPVGRVLDLVPHPPPPGDLLPQRSTVPPIRLLVADDYEDAAESLAMLMSTMGLETAVAFDGEQALSRALSWRPQICVLDIDMPELDGREVARRIRRQTWADPPLLIALTGWTTNEDIRLAYEAGFDHYLIKPVEPYRLVQLMQNYLVQRIR